MPAALDLTAELTAPYTPKHFFEARAAPRVKHASLTSLQEIQGLADALDGAVSYKTILELQMFPELIKASCTMIGAWGPAIENCAGLSVDRPALPEPERRVAAHSAARAGLWPDHAAGQLLDAVRLPSAGGCGGAYVRRCGNG